MQHAEGRRVVEEIPAEYACGIDGDQEVKAIAPLARIRLKAVSDSCCQRTCRSRHQIAIRVGPVAVLHRNQLGNDPEERLLESDRDPDEELRNDQDVDGLRESTDDGSEQGDGRAEDEEPPPAENVAELPDHQEEDGAARQVHERDPVDVWRGANIGIDLTEHRRDQPIS